MLVLLASNWINGSFFSTISTLSYPLKAWFIFITHNSSWKGSSENKSMLFKRLTLVFPWAYYKMEVLWNGNILPHVDEISFSSNCHYYTLQKCLI